eukprot:CAMPEP_0197434460 /NCGR_PEP_ID=MMETSP1175-20131217/2181_1 /TAXON_ID=1003142 /ORGANISM="Triceratium dubium, Strain CCMP147" /LENGTH=250 /DNA_ID=CAMNT_0042963181 /DNA_START=9 /DNA_END=761 /DNA_ORIENTATION=+
MKLAILSATISAACAFSPSVHKASSTTAHRMSEAPTEEAVSTEPVDIEAATPEVAVAAPTVAAINGWVPDETKPLYGLPGAIAPFGFFDPLGFSSNLELQGAKRFREAEIMHGRVAMMATVGYLLGENTPTITYGMKTLADHHVLANNMIPEVPGTVLFPFFLAINIAEAIRASIGWVEPGLGPLFTLRENYYPGDIRFDPFGLKPKTAEEFVDMQNKELSNGRLAMLAAAGMCVQEQVTGKGVLEAIGF